MRAALPHTEGIVDRDGVKIHYEIYGEGDRTLLFIPTWSFVHSRVYKAQIPYFAEHFRVMTFDPRGNGKSDRPSRVEEYQLDRSVGDVLAVLRETDTETASLFGYSYSGLVGAVVAANHPESVDALIAVGSFSPLFAGHADRSALDFEAKLESHEGWEKFNRDHWLHDYPDFIEFFCSQITNEPHSTKQIEDGIAWAGEGDGEMLAMTQDASAGGVVVDEAMYRNIRCPVLLIHGTNDAVRPAATSEKIAELTGAELHLIQGAGHAPHARFPAKVNLLMRDFLVQRLSGWKSSPRPKRQAAQPRVLYLSSPIGLGHGRRDLAITRELRTRLPGLQVDWLAQDPVTRFLDANDERVHPASSRLASESSHIESEAGEHDLNAFQAIRRMDEILVKNFMIFQEVLEQDEYDLVIADEAWDVDHYWHEHPELKRSQIAWLTDFVGWVPMPGGGEREAFLTTDYNAEMIGHVEDHPQLRDRAIFVGNPNDIVPLGFGQDLPHMRDWVPQHFDFCGYVLGRHPDDFGPRDELRQRFGWRSDEKICVVTVGGSGVGGTLIRRILEAYPIAKRAIPDLRMVVVTGPRLDPASFSLPPGVEAHGFIPDLDQALSAADLALVQGGLTTTMELAAAGTPFLYFPLRNHFEQNVHVAHRLDQYDAGRKMIFGECDPDRIAQAMVDELRSPRIPTRVESDGAARAADMLAAML